MELYLHSPTRLHGMVLNLLNTGKILPVFNFMLNKGKVVPVFI
jgi:hypothetical protein